MKFEKLCRFGGEYYAVECDGKEVTAGKATYAVDKHMTKNEWVVTFVYNGIRVGEYTTQKAAVEDVQRIHEVLKAADKSKLPPKSTLENATKINKADYLEMIQKGTDDGE